MEDLSFDVVEHMIVLGGYEQIFKFINLCLEDHGRILCNMHERLRGGKGRWQHIVFWHLYALRLFFGMVMEVVERNWRWLGPPVASRLWWLWHLVVAPCVKGDTVEKTVDVIGLLMVRVGVIVSCCVLPSNGSCGCWAEERGRSSFLGWLYYDSCSVCFGMFVITGKNWLGLSN